MSFGRRATRRFEVRFEGVQASVRDAGRAIEDCTLEELDVIWEDVKRRDHGSGSGSDAP